MAREECAAVSLRGCLFMIGGYNDLWPGVVDEGSPYLRMVERFNPRLFEWEAQSPMPHRCICPSAISLADQLYVIGRTGLDSALVFLHFDPSSISWEQLPYTYM